MNINIKKKALSLLCASCVLVTSNVYAEMKVENDYVDAKTDVNIRLSDTTKSNKLGLFDYRNSAYRILSVNNWDLIRYNDIIGYVCHQYVNVKDEKGNDFHQYTEVHDILYTTDNLNLRLGPSTDYKKIDLIKINTEIIPIAVTNDNWYLVKYNGKIGYVCGDYVRLLSEEIKSKFPNVKNGSIKKIVYATKNDFILDSKGDITGVIEKYECAYLLDSNNDYSFIKTPNYMGYVTSSSLKAIDERLVEIDLSDQRITLYYNNDILIRSSVVSGKNTTPTNIGSFKIYNKETDRYLKGSDYNVHVDYWMPFDGGIGLHDSSRDQFGGNIYKNNGSHGCINLPHDVAEYIYNNVKTGTKVLVHK